jgi:CRISPR/Cas system CMR-associated protein Cmr5 small subunit
MGVWTEYCICCGLAFDTYTKQFLTEVYDEDNESLDTLLYTKFPNTRWLHNAIGIDRFEKIIPLGQYNDYGGFASKYGTFNTVTNIENKNNKPNQDYGIVCHRACYSILKTDLGVTLLFDTIWPKLLKQHNPSNMLASLNYGTVKMYQNQDFDLVKMVEDNNEWMLENPFKSTKSKERILKIVKPLKHFE